MNRPAVRRRDSSRPPATPSGTARVQKEPLTPAELARLAAVLPRDRAVLLLGFAAALALRRSELTALCRRDLLFTGEGLALVLRRANDDQEGCPVGALKAG